MKEVFQDQIIKIPKVELHCHLDGSIRTESIIDQAKIDDVNIPSKNIQTLNSIIKIIGQESSLEDYLEKFKITLSVMQTPGALERFAFELIEDVYKENVVYIEVRFSPIFHTNSGMTTETSIRSVNKGLKKGEKKYGVKSCIIICGIRNMHPETSFKLAKLAIKHKSHGVVGFDLAGPENYFPAKNHKKSFKLVKENGLKCTIHAGEAKGPSSIHQAIYDCGADRIGHGTRLHEDSKLLNMIKTKKIPLEICLTSNWQTNCIDSLKEHPLKLYYELGLIISLNTDNRLISNTNLINEMRLVNNLFGFDLKDFKNITIMSMKSAFINNSIKKERINLILNQYKKITSL